MGLAEIDGEPHRVPCLLVVLTVPSFLLGLNAFREIMKHSWDKPAGNRSSAGAEIRIKAIAHCRFVIFLSLAFRDLGFS